MTKLVLPTVLNERHTWCPECNAMFPTGPEVCPICAEVPAGACGSNDPGEDRLIDG